jgi:hypothetical protein
MYLHNYMQMPCRKRKEQPFSFLDSIIWWHLKCLIASGGLTTLLQQELQAGEILSFLKCATIYSVHWNFCIHNMKLIKIEQTMILIIFLFSSLSSFFYHIFLFYDIFCIHHSLLMIHYFLCGYVSNYLNRYTSN